MKFILGTVQLGLDYGIQENEQPDINEALRILNTAYAAGITIFDTASTYGLAENILNRFLSQTQIQKDSISIITKAKSPIKDLGNSIKSSLSRLGINKLEGFLFHDPNYIFDPKAIDALKEIKDRGLTNKIGASIYTPEQAAKALEYDVIDLIQVPYNVFDRRLDKCGFFELAREKDIEVHARSVLLQGLLMIDSEHLPKHMVFAKPYIELFRTICRENNLDPFNAAVQFVLKHEHINGMVFGVDNTMQLEEYLALDLDDTGIDIRSIFNRNIFEENEKLIMPNLW